jgi:hypothetical protein
MKEEIYKICTKLNDGQIAVVEAQEQLLLLFSVSNRRELLIAFLDDINARSYEHIKTDEGKVDAFLSNL